MPEIHLLPPSTSSKGGARHPVLDVLTVLAMAAGLGIGIDLALSGRPALPSILGGVLLLPVLVRLAGHGALSLGRRHGLLAPEPPRRTGRPGGEQALSPTTRRVPPEEAVRIHRERSEEDPSDPEPWLEIARVEREHLRRPHRAADALREARRRIPRDSGRAGLVARELAELHLGPLRSPRSAMPELARAAELLEGTAHGEWARSTLADLKKRMADGEMDPTLMESPPPPADLLQELDVLLRTRYGLILVPTDEEDRALTLLRHAADRRRLPLFVWTPSRGLTLHGRDEPVYDTKDPVKALRHIEVSDTPALYHLRSFGSYLGRDEPALRHHLEDAARTLEAGPGAIVLTGAAEQVPAEIRGLAAVLRLPDPEARDYRTLLARVLRDVESRMRVEVEMTLPEQERLIGNLRGLTLMEAEKLLTKLIVEDGRLASRDIDRIIAAKRDVIEQEGVLEYYPTDTDWTDIADLAGLKAWLRQRRTVVADPAGAAEFGLSFPRGILLLGVPGCGKSLCAKAVAMDWRLPLLKLDPSALYNKYIGETEKNFRRAMETAERMAPLVLWIDEIEKAFASGGEQDGGVSQRVLGTFLSWMQERKRDVFIVATANDVQRLPPELLRKGRFDETFFVDLPDAETRAAIFRVHLGRRGQEAERFQLAELAAATDGFSGAEIEQVVVSALYHAFSAGEDLTDAGLLDEAARTRPLSVTMAEKIEALRRWARGRTRSAQVDAEAAAGAGP